MIERSLVLVKPDGIKRQLVGRIIQRFEERGLKIVSMKMVWVDEKFARTHYTEEISNRHGEKIRTMLVNYIKEGPVVAMVLQGVSAVDIVRKICGNTYPDEAPLGTIRGDFAHVSKVYAISNNKDVRNLVHASANKEDAKKEIKLWFKEKELHDYKIAHEDHIL